MSKCTALSNAATPYQAGEARITHCGSLAAPTLFGQVASRPSGPTVARQAGHLHPAPQMRCKVATGIQLSILLAVQITRGAMVKGVAMPGKRWARPLVCACPHLYALLRAHAHTYTCMRACSTPEAVIQQATRDAEAAPAVEDDLDLPDDDGGASLPIKVWVRLWPLRDCSQGAIG
eukprot:365224-Chlamydomonas_euryale.AAC.5